MIMSATTAADPEAAHAPVGDDARQDGQIDQRARDGDDKAATSEQETSVGNILAQLNQEQLESIVAAARASEANRRQEGHADGADNVSDPYANLADLPASLGQAATALTSFASSFKRSGLPLERAEGEGGKLDDAPPPPDTEFQAHTPPPPPNEGRDGAHHQHAHTNGGGGAAKAAHDTATAVAIASLGSLAAQQSQANAHRQHHSNHHQAASPSPSSARGGAEAGSPDGTSGSSLGKRSRGPEMDRARKDNHKEVERRRRSAIADGITQLSQIVPGCDAKSTNKSSIIVAAVKYIQDLKNNEASNIEKWTLEKLLMDQAMGDLQAQLEEFRRDNEALRHLLAARGWTDEGEGEGEVEGAHHDAHALHHHQHHQPAEEEAIVQPDLDQRDKEEVQATADHQAGLEGGSDKRSLDDMHHDAAETKEQRAKRTKLAV